MVADNYIAKLLSILSNDTFVQYDIACGKIVA